MISWKVAAEEITTGANKTIENLNGSQVNKPIEMIIEAKNKKIFIDGMGRSGFFGRAFASRLMNPGFNVCFIGETITPATEHGDLVIVISSTGETEVAVTASMVAKEIGAKVTAISSYPGSSLAKAADHVLTMEGRTKMGWPHEEDYLTRQILGEKESLTPLGSMFENNYMIFLDGLVVELMHRLKKTEEELKAKHATIE